MRLALALGKDFSNEIVELMSNSSLVCVYCRLIVSSVPSIFKYDLCHFIQTSSLGHTNPVTILTDPMCLCRTLCGRGMMFVPFVLGLSSQGSRYCVIIVTNGRRTSIVYGTQSSLSLMDYGFAIFVER